MRLPQFQIRVRWMMFAVATVAIALAFDEALRQIGTSSNLSAQASNLREYADRLEQRGDAYDIPEKRRREARGYNELAMNHLLRAMPAVAVAVTGGFLVLVWLAIYVKSARNRNNLGKWSTTMETVSQTGALVIFSAMGVTGFIRCVAAFLPIR